MIHYRDMTFCSAACANRDCPRNFTDEVKLARANGGVKKVRLFHLRILAKIVGSMRRNDHARLH